MVDRPESFAEEVARRQAELMKQDRNGGEQAIVREPSTIKVALNDSRIGAAGTTTQTQAIPITGRTLRMSSLSHSSARLEVLFDYWTNDQSKWIPLRSTSVTKKPDGSVFSQIFLRRFDANVPATSNLAVLVADDPPESTTDQGAFSQVSPGGSVQNLLVATRGSDLVTEQPVISDDNGALVIAGWDGTLYQRISVGPNGPLAGRVNVSRVQDNTYEASIAAIAGPVGAFLEVLGSGSKSARVLEVLVQPDAACIVTVEKHSSAYTGGTSASPTLVPVASVNPAATANVKTYTVIPSGGGALVGEVGRYKLAAGQPLIYKPGDVDDGQRGILASAAETFAFKSDTIVNWYGHVVWSER